MLQAVACIGGAWHTILAKQRSIYSTAPYCLAYRTGWNKNKPLVIVR